MRCDAWRVAADRCVSLDPWCLMGILNATPDSFSDGGLHLDPERAASHGVALVDAGASIIDVGGESTRPGAERIAPAEQIDRVVPVVSALRSALGERDVVITVDTTSAEVAAAALEVGANAVNDVSGGTEDPEMLRLIAQRDVGIILMHRLAPPDLDSYSDRYDAEPEYGDVVRAVTEALAGRIREAEATGIAPASIMVDPGFGFGKSVEQNFELMRGLDELTRLGRPVLVGLSRKSFLGATTDTTNPADRDLESAVAAVLLGSPRGLVQRVHDVAGHQRALMVGEAVRGHRMAAEPGSSRPRTR